MVYYLVNRDLPEKGLQLYLKALEIDPNNTQAIKGSAFCYRRLGKTDKAQEMLNRLPAGQ